MHNVLILLDNLTEWKPFYPTESILSVSDYLKQKNIGQESCFVLNLSPDLSYNSEGYYCSLLAQARGHQIIPGAETINKLESGAVIRMDNQLQKLCYQWIQKNNITDDIWYFNIYFGTCIEKGLEKIARYIFEHYPSPLLKVTLNNRPRNQIENVQILNFKELDDKEQDYFADALDSFNKKVWRAPRSPKSPRYNIAIFHDPNEEFPPSDKRALKKFLDISKKMNIYTELITEEDITRLMEFDALFIRSTTSLNHITYHISQKAKLADILVIDDPLSIIRCTNKVYLKELLVKEKIPAPKSYLLFKSSNHSYQEIVNELGSPFILKISDGSFSHGIKKIKNEEELISTMNVLFGKSAVLLAQEFIPTEFDWRIGVLNGEPLFACKYYMAKGHWKIYYHSPSGSRCGTVETIPIYQVPRNIIKTALKATSFIGKGLYGVDMKMIDNEAIVIEINDNPNIDHGVEDAILGDELYYRILNYFVRALELKHH